MDPTSYHYNDDVKNMEFEEDHFVKHVCAIGVYYYYSCDICSSSRLASILQEEGYYCLECWQERMRRKM